MGISIDTNVESGGAVVVTVRGAVEHDEAGLIAAAVGAALDRYRPSVICVDLGLVTYLDSAGIGALAGSQRRARSAGSRVLVRNPSQFVARVLSVSGLDELLR